MLDHADEGALAKYQIRTPKVASKAINIREVWNPVLYLPMYNAHQCVIRTPIFRLHLR